MKSKFLAKTAKGGMTVETALIMPVILYIIMLLLYFLLFMYNCSVMTDAALIAVRQTVYYENGTNAVIEKNIKEKCLESLSGRLVGMENLSMTVSVGKFQSSVKLTGNPVMANIGVFGKEVPFHTIEVEEKAERLRPGQFIRNVRKGLKLKEWISERSMGKDELPVQTGHEPQLPDSGEGVQLLPGPGDVSE